MISLKRSSTALLLAAVSSSAVALTPIPKETGISGFINLGVMGMSVESNMVAETPFGDLGADTVDDLNSDATSESVALPVAGFELSYTWAESGTQIFLGNRLEDVLRFDFSTVAGIRQEVGTLGVLGLEVINSSLESKVWSDPYLTGQERKAIERTSKGARLIWDRAFGSNFEFKLSNRKIELDGETSGAGLGLTAEEMASLNREGDTKRFDASYLIKTEGSGVFIPRISKVDYDRDGSAMTNDGAEIGLTHIIKRGEIKYVSNLAYSSFDFDEINPVFDETDAYNRSAVSLTAFWDDAFGLKGWTGNAGVMWFQESHDISFYDAQAAGVSVGMLHRF